jgi:hypothetical protein
VSATTPSRVVLAIASLASEAASELQGQLACSVDLEVSPICPFPFSTSGFFPPSLLIPFGLLVIGEPSRLLLPLNPFIYGWSRNLIPVTSFSPLQTSRRSGLLLGALETHSCEFDGPLCLFQTTRRPFTRIVERLESMGQVCCCFMAGDY